MSTTHLSEALQGIAADMANDAELCIEEGSDDTAETLAYYLARVRDLIEDLQ